SIGIGRAGRPAAGKRWKTAPLSPATTEATTEERGDHSQTTRLLLLGGFMRHRTLMRLGRLAMRGMMMCRLFMMRFHRARRRSRRIGRRNVERRRGECECGNQSESNWQFIHCVILLVGQSPSP